VASILKRGSDYYLVFGIAKSYDQVSAESLRIAEMIGEEINGEIDD
jgi:hypothetical protein